MKKLLLSFSVVVLFLQSCVKDETFTREDYIGSWTCEETSSLNGPSKFTVHMREGTGSDEIVMENFYNFGFQEKVKASVVEDNLTINSQTFAGSSTVSGSGTMVSKSKITMSYSVVDSSGTDNVTATFTKQ